MSCHKLLQSHLPRHFHYLIGISLVLIWLLYVLYLVVGLSFNPFLILAIHCNSDEKYYQCQNIVLNNKTEPLFLEFNRWIKSLFAPMGRHSWECWQRHESIWHGTIRLLFRECRPLGTRSSFKRFLYCGSKVLGVVQSTKCVVLKWETVCRSSTYVVRSFFYLDIGFFRHPLLRPAMLPFSQTYLIRIFQKPHRRYPRVLRNETAATVSVRPV